MVPGSCAKQITMAVIVNGDKYWVGTNWCKNPQQSCPRKDMPSGQGYELCREVCQQPNHAEVDACIKAGDMAKGATLYLFGHSYCCDNCMRVMKQYGISKVVLAHLEGRR